jgi:hypothetical protein
MRGRAWVLTLRTAMRQQENALHPAWRAFLHFCRELQHGEIERLRIQDGVPVIAEVVKKKVKFTE